MKIKDITQKDGTNFFRFSILDYGNGRFALITNKFIWIKDEREQVRVETSTRRLKQLANDILNYLNVEAKIKEWNPTMDDFEIKLREKWNNDEIFMEMWFIDWVRFPEKNRKIQARKIYE